MATTYSEYSVDSEIEAFFKKTSATRAACDARARELAGENVVPVDVQGVCSYSVYAGPELEYVVQFRLESLALKTGVTSLAAQVYGSLTPKVSFEGKVGDGGKEPLYIYLMSRPVSPEYCGILRQTYIRDLRLLHAALPSRFQPIVQTCIDSIDDILSLPLVLLHRDFGSCNIMVEEATCHLVGVIDWAEAELHVRNGWTQFGDYDTLQDVFWERFKREVGGLSDDQLRTIKLARTLGLLLSHGFTSRISNEPLSVPIGDDEHGRYNTMSLDGFLINP
ncbi:hypothetical protein N0V84_005051 [Fusarium piperis]|uniref:Aminoglycoside phosphotransferase domain-containing protein n=1 Tax=Fusarium piperis TaxID=1435070 RepID=A0A9W8WEI0_9HYPO|nr:hypothetical protein N0V84_005051 [Fusarium piperis]